MFNVDLQKKTYHRPTLSYEHRLAQLNIDSMQIRRVTTDLILCYKMLHGLVDIDVSSFFSLSVMCCILEVIVKAG